MSAQETGGACFGLVLTPSALRTIGTAVEFYRRTMARNGHPGTAELEALSRQLIALGSGRESTGGHRGPMFAPLTTAVDGGNMELLTRPAAARRLGVSVSTLKRREAAGLIVALRSGRTVRYRAGDITTHMEGLTSC